MMMSQRLHKNIDESTSELNFIYFVLVGNDFQQRVLMMFRESLIKLFCQLQNCRQRPRQLSLVLNHYPNCGNDRRF